jgi:hypothetical protein
METRLVEVSGKVYVAIGRWLFKSIPEAHGFLGDGGNAGYIPENWEYDANGQALVRVVS